MSSPARSTRFFGPRNVPIGATTLYTVPAGFTARITLLRTVNSGAAAALISYSIGALLPGTIVSYLPSLAAFSSASDAGPIVLAAGQTLVANTIAATTLSISAHGALLVA